MWVGGTGGGARFGLGIGRLLAQRSGMGTNPPPQNPPQAWLDALKEGEADLAAMEHGADDAEKERLLRVLDALGEDTHEDAPAARTR